MIGFADAGPARHRLRSPPSQIAHGRSGEGDALIGGRTLRIGDAGNGAIRGVNDVRFSNRKERNCYGDGCYGWKHPRSANHGSSLGNDQLRLAGLCTMPATNADVNSRTLDLPSPLMQLFAKLFCNMYECILGILNRFLLRVKKVIPPR
jgi:hypothetical protein